MSGQMRRAAVIGTTSWGTTLALLLARAGAQTLLWARTEDAAQRMNSAGENVDRLVGFPFPPNLSVTADMNEAIAEAGIVIVCVPSHSFRENILRLKSVGPPPQAIILSATKGLERSTGMRMSEVFAQEFGQDALSRFCVLSGPNLAQEVATGMPSSAVIACRDEGIAEMAQAALTSAMFRVYTSRDVVGVELGGSLKNIVAIGAGMIDGMKFGDNAKAAFISRAIAEITRLGLAAGAQRMTFSGLACMGDLVATCYSRLSRNRHVGEQLGMGRALADILRDLNNQVAEGVDTTPAALQLAELLNVDVPITRQTYRVLYENLGPTEALEALMARPATSEYDDDRP